METVPAIVGETTLDSETAMSGEALSKGADGDDDDPETAKPPGESC